MGSDATLEVGHQGVGITPVESDAVMNILCRGILAALEHGRAGEVNNFGSGAERENIEVVRRILDHTGAPESLIEHAVDRRSSCSPGFGTYCSSRLPATFPSTARSLVSWGNRISRRITREMRPAFAGC